MAEFLAMTLFVFISIGSALGFNYPLKGNNTSGATQDNVKVSLAFGLSIATLAQSVGHISGAHLNPAVTLGLLLSCQISILRAVLYIISQCVGAIVATAILSGITSSLSNNSLGRNEVSRAAPTSGGVSRAVLRWHRSHPPPIVQMGTSRNRGAGVAGGHAWGWDSAAPAARSLFAARHCGELRPREQQFCQCPLWSSIVRNNLEVAIVWASLSPLTGSFWPLQLCLCSQLPPPAAWALGKLPCVSSHPKAGTRYVCSLFCKCVGRTPVGGPRGLQATLTFTKVRKRTAFKETGPPTLLAPGMGHRLGVENALWAVCRWFSWIRV